MATTQASSDNGANYVDRTVFLNSVTTLYAICSVLLALRTVVRLKSRKQLCVDDGFLLFGYACLTAAFIALHYMIDTMYLVQMVLEQGFGRVSIPSDFIQRSLDLSKWSFATSFLSTATVCCVRFSFIFLFRTLLSHLRPLRIYWWLILGFNVIVSAYNLTSAYISCPQLFGIEGAKCVSSAGTSRTKIVIGTALGSEILSELLILVIPVYLIWNIKVRLSQKIPLSVSLCLTVVLIALSVVRLSGLRQAGQVSLVWLLFWNFLVAEVGLILAAATAFRSLFVAHAARRQHDAFHRRYWERRRSPGMKGQTPQDGDAVPRGGGVAAIPWGRGMTGLRTIFSGWARTVVSEHATLVDDEESQNGLQVVKMPPPVYNFSKPLPPVPRPLMASSPVSSTLRASRFTEERLEKS